MTEMEAEHGQECRITRNMSRSTVLPGEQDGTLDTLTLDFCEYHQQRIIVHGMGMATPGLGTT